MLHLSRYLSLGVPGYFQGARIFPHFDAEAASANKKPWLALVLFDGAIVSPTHDITLADRADHLLSRPELRHTPSCEMDESIADIDGSLFGVVQP